MTSPEKKLDPTKVWLKIVHGSKRHVFVFPVSEVVKMDHETTRDFPAEERFVIYTDKAKYWVEGKHSEAILKVFALCYPIIEVDLT